MHEALGKRWLLAKFGQASEKNFGGDVAHVVGNYWAAKLASILCLGRVIIAH